MSENRNIYHYMTNPYRNIVYVPLRGDFYIRCDVESVHAATLDEAMAIRDQLEEKRKQAA